MSMLGAFVAVMGGLQDIVADWADINFASPTADAANANVTLTFTGAARTLEVTDAGLVGTLEYRINSGSYVACPTGTTFAVASGNTLNFRYAANGLNASATVTVRDQTDGARIIDTFNVNVFGY